MPTDAAERMAAAAADLLALLPAELRREVQLDFADMEEGQRELLCHLVRVYVGRLDGDFGADLLSQHYRRDHR